MPEAAATSRRFDEPDELRKFPLGRLELTDGRIIEVGPGDLFEIGPGHDSVVIGDEPYVSIHFLGADTYAK